ncbi:hypothetical protein VIGAN_01016600 [Vigna angularis var. angularis]|uniref:Uncharacterized protein n=1 Tax=Vigna angularis var. angularis TaxID=157739 RepID=A0A0S3QWK4_PHAAN|nr:hypothetical protein VIGAN_01016600 [Vigna angularis var. angularis]
MCFFYASQFDLIYLLLLILILYIAAFFIQCPQIHFQLKFIQCPQMCYMDYRKMLYGGYIYECTCVRNKLDIFW